MLGTKKKNMWKSKMKFLCVFQYCDGWCMKEVYNLNAYKSARFWHKDPPKSKVNVKTCKNLLLMVMHKYVWQFQSPSPQSKYTFFFYKNATLALPLPHDLQSHYLWCDMNVGAWKRMYCNSYKSDGANAYKDIIYSTLGDEIYNFHEEYGTCVLMQNMWYNASL